MHRFVVHQLRRRFQASVHRHVHQPDPADLGSEPDDREGDLRATRRRPAADLVGCATPTADGWSPTPTRSRLAGAGLLADLRVVDVATVLAGPGCARYLADFRRRRHQSRAPRRGDTTRTMVGSDPATTSVPHWQGGRATSAPSRLTRRTPTAGAFLRSARPPTCWSRTSGPARLERARHRARRPERRQPVGRHLVTGFGQDGPSRRPARLRHPSPRPCRASPPINGEGTTAGQVFPPIGDRRGHRPWRRSRTMVALHSGVGQVVDVNLLESMFQPMGTTRSRYLLPG